MTLRFPVVQASLGACDGPRLAATVSNAGGLGTQTVHALPLALYRRQLARLRRLTPRPVLLAFNAEWESEAILLSSLDAGFRHFQVFWWNGPRLTRQIHAADGFVFWQVGSAAQARDALEAGADVLIAQGTEAGGQVRTSLPLHDLIGAIRGMPGGEFVPLVAGGGLANRSDVRAVLAAGANAALLGTRFLLTEEAAAPLADKHRLLRAESDSLILDPRMIGDWPCAPRRRLLVAGEEDRASLFAGLGVGRMRRLLSAEAVVRGLGG